ncbi:Nucleotide-binding universal stress protein, UspA family [Saccharopolyspora shandongensis]|uniref:Nucleotide-binding universal stress protein, UspA family n=1 Tax=Saccharopolyspora shandongensis TaxID=418495 RepID=A0A1H3QX37_9PSEU|nr:universal stress protein [Saccharopolyspora shandongensis]SDZ17823.1 Nucleotide-binding universal stress protein, UspA family [Saccharopolyspora shandongensis]
MSEQRDYAIVVGVDGSPSSRVALRWAVRQAHLTNGLVTAVMSWELPELYDWPMRTSEECDRATEEALKTVIRETVDDADAAAIRKEVARGHPANALLKAAGSADLLVVGRRGYGGFAHALLGSVGQYCVNHAPCPVVVVRDHA